MRHRFLYAALVGFTVFLILFEIRLMVDLTQVEDSSPVEVSSPVEDSSPVKVSSPVEVSSAPEETWVKYTHDYFYLRYPPSWTIQENTDPDMLVLFDGEESADQYAESFEVSLYVEEKETTALETIQTMVEKAMAEAPEEVKYENLDQREFNYGGGRAVSLLSRIELNGVPEKIITYIRVVPKGKKTFTVFYMVEEKNYDKLRLRKILDSLVLRF